MADVDAAALRGELEQAIHNLPPHQLASVNSVVALNAIWPLVASRLAEVTQQNADLQRENAELRAKIIGAQQ